MPNKETTSHTRGGETLCVSHFIRHAYHTSTRLTHRLTHSPSPKQQTSTDQTAFAKAITSFFQNPFLHPSYIHPPTSAYTYKHTHTTTTHRNQKHVRPPLHRHCPSPSSSSSPRIHTHYRGDINNNNTTTTTSSDAGPFRGSQCCVGNNGRHRGVPSGNSYRCE